jgi:acyl carrier protein
MNRDQIRNKLFESLRSVAPESEPETLGPDANVREELDLDSMDFLNFVTALHKALALDIPEADYRTLSTLRGAEEYLSQKLA